MAVRALELAGRRQPGTSEPVAVSYVHVDGRGDCCVGDLGGRVAGRGVGVNGDQRTKGRRVGLSVGQQI